MACHLPEEVSTLVENGAGPYDAPHLLAVGVVFEESTETLKFELTSVLHKISLHAGLVSHAHVALGEGGPAHQGGGQSVCDLVQGQAFL